MFDIQVFHSSESYCIDCSGLTITLLSCLRVCWRELATHLQRTSILSIQWRRIFHMHCCELQFHNPLSYFRFCRTRLSFFAYVLGFICKFCDINLLLWQYATGIFLVLLLRFRESLKVCKPFWGSYISFSAEKCC